MKRLLLTAHAPSENTALLLDSARAGVKEFGRGLELIEKPPLSVGAEDLLTADGLLLGSLENIGALAGLTKDMFDRCYHDWLDKKPGLPVAVYIRAGLDGTASKRQIEAIITAQKWRLIDQPLILKGAWQPAFEKSTAELAAALAAGMEANIF